MALNREKFAAAAENLYSTIKYIQTDCIGFVKLCAKEAGQSISSSGTNYTWRYGLSDKGDTSSYNIQIGDVVFRYYNPGDPYYSLPSKYAKDPDQRDVHHIGIVTNVSDGKYTVCDSRSSIKNGQKEVFSSKKALTAKWTLVGTLKNTANPTGAIIPTPTPAPVVKPETPVQTPSKVETVTTTPRIMKGKYPLVPFDVTVKISNLNHRQLPTTNSKSYGYIPKGKYTVYCVDEPNDLNSWGLIILKDKTAWINLNKNYVSW